MLPGGHYGGRKGRYIEDALLDPVETVYGAWNEGRVATLVSMDITGAYDHVSHNMAKRGLGGQCATWTRSFLGGRETKVRLPDMETELEEVSVGIPQGSRPGASSQP